MKLLKSILWEVSLYIGVMIVYFGIPLLFFLLLDYVYNFEINMFDEGLMRVFVVIWFLFITFAFIVAQYGNKIKKYIP